MCDVGAFEVPSWAALEAGRAKLRPPQRGGKGFDPARARSHAGVGRLSFWRTRKKAPPQVEHPRAASAWGCSPKLLRRHELHAYNYAEVAVEAP